MSKTKWRPGSAGEKEAKEQKIVKPILIALTLLLLAVQFLIPSEYRDAVIYTSNILNVIGGVLVGCSAIPVILSYNAGEEGSYGYAVAWFLMLAAGFLIAACQAI